MKTAITEFLDREEKLDIRNKEADEALQEYQTTGQYVSYEKMDEWLETWGKDKESVCPEPED
jgi:predicted transcriptional regulator